MAELLFEPSALHLGCPGEQKVTEGSCTSLGHPRHLRVPDPPPGSALLGAQEAGVGSEAALLGLLQFSWFRHCQPSPRKSQKRKLKDKPRKGFGGKVE